LSEAQNEVIADIAAICPSVLYPTVANASLPTLSTSDNQVYTFGTDANGYSIAPIGRVAIFATLNDIPTSPWREGRDFIRTGATAIRIPNNGSYSGTLYWLGVTNPPDITASVQPSLFPEASRELITLKAALNFGTEGKRDLELSSAMAARYGERFARWCTTWRTQYRRGGAMGSVTGMQLALGSQFNSFA
jgi:hypothetical protein